MAFYANEMAPKGAHLRPPTPPNLCTLTPAVSIFPPLTKPLHPRPPAVDVRAPEKYFAHFDTKHVRHNLGTVVFLG